MANLAGEWKRRDAANEDKRQKEREEKRHADEERMKAEIGTLPTLRGSGIRHSSGRMGGDQQSGGLGFGADTSNELAELEAVSPSVAPSYQRGVPTPPPSPPASLRRSSMNSERGAVAELNAQINLQKTLIGTLRSDLTREQLEVERLGHELEAFEEDHLTAVLNNDGEKIAALEITVDRLELLIRKSQDKVKELNLNLAESRDKEGSLLDQLHEA
ncbi:hypothetical protein MMC09_002261 [Bachmanniomyces sp. S44760]|nr:hypothetical protein [Bachmanniomyces sp. S44760]